MDLPGRPLLPGFQDAHVHPVIAGITMCAATWTAPRTWTARWPGSSPTPPAHPDRSGSTGGGWWMEWFPGGAPTRELLDRVVPDRPVYLINRDHHGAWVNSRALELAGHDRDAPPTRPTAGSSAGRRRRRAPAGGRRGNWSAGWCPAPTFAERVAGLLLAQQHLHSLGVTAWQDAIVGDYLGIAGPLAGLPGRGLDGTLTARVGARCGGTASRGAEQTRTTCSSGGSGPGAAGSGPTRSKIMQDGVAENFTAAMIDPYLDGCGCQHRQPRACPSSTPPPCPAT